MELILLAYGLPKEFVTAVMMPYKNTKADVRLRDSDNDLFHIVAGLLQGDTLALFLFITFIDLMKENHSTRRKARSERYPAKTIIEADFLQIHLLKPNPCWSRQQKALVSRWTQIKKIVIVF